MKSEKNKKEINGKEFRPEHTTTLLRYFTQNAGKIRVNVCSAVRVITHRIKFHNNLTIQLVLKN